MTEHQKRVRKFMESGGQVVRSKPTSDLPAGELELRCRLLLEEVMEFVDAAGFEVYLGQPERDWANGLDAKKASLRKGTLKSVRKPNIIEMADACADISVINIGTMVAMGIDDEPLLAEVDRSNLDKIGPDGKIIKRDDGKILKPEGWEPPNIERVLVEQGWEPPRVVRSSVDVQHETIKFPGQ